MITTFTFLVLMASFGLVVFRVIKGPAAPDRIIAVDVLSSLTVGVIGVHAVASGTEEYIDIAVVVALIGFLGTVAFAYFVDHEPGREP